MNFGVYWTELGLEPRLELERIYYGTGMELIWMQIDTSEGKMLIYDTRMMMGIGLCKLQCEK